MTMNIIVQTVKIYKGTEGDLNFFLFPCLIQPPKRSLTFEPYRIKGREIQGKIG